MGVTDDEVNGAAPAATIADDDVRAAVDAAVAAHGQEPGPLLVVLQAVVEQLGYVPAEAIPLVADGLNVSRADVHGVVSFYTDLHTEPRGAHLVQLCRAEACQSVGAQRMIDELTQRLDVPLGGTSANGAYTLEEVFCLGNCALGPSAAIDGQLVGRASAPGLSERIAGLEAKGTGA